jgi:hypothetical protein
MKPKNPVLYGILEQRRILIEKGYNFYSLHEGQMDDGIDPSERRKAMSKGGGELEDIGEYVKIIAELMVDLTPLVGDAKGVYEAIQALSAGDTPTAALALVASIPGAGLPADVSRAFGKATKRLSALKSIPKAPPQVPMPKLPDYTKPSSIPGAKPVEIPPRYSPERPPTMPRPKPGETPAPKPQEPPTPAPKPQEPPAPKPEEPHTPAPKPQEPPAPKPEEPATPTPEQPPAPNQPKPYTPPRLPRLPRIPKFDPNAYPESIPETETEGDIDTGTGIETTTFPVTDTETSGQTYIPFLPKLQRQRSTSSSTRTDTDQETKSKLKKDDSTDKKTQTGEQDPKIPKPNLPLPSLKIDPQIPKVPDTVLSGDFDDINVGLYLSKLLGKYSGTSRIR